MEPNLTVLHHWVDDNTHELHLSVKLQGKMPETINYKNRQYYLSYEYHGKEAFAHYTTHK